MLLVCFAIILSLPLGADELEQSLSALRKVSASVSETQTLIETIRASQPNDDKRVVEGLVSIWENYADCEWGVGLRTISLACEKSGDRTAGIILRAAAAMLDSKSAKKRERAAQLFGTPGVVLSGKLSDPEPLLKLAADQGCLRLIARSTCNSELRERYLLRGLRQRGLPKGQSVTSLICHVSDSAIPKIRGIVANLQRTNPQSKMFEIGLRTLVDAEDTGILPLLKSRAGDSRVDQEQRELARVYRSKLRHQHSTDELLRILRTEKKSETVLRWTVWRLLWLKSPKQAIRAALEQNRNDSGPARGIAANVDAYFFENLEGLNSGSPRWRADRLMLDREDLLRDCAEPEPAGMSALLERLDRYSLPALLEAAP